MEEKLKNYSQQKNLSKTHIVKEALAMYFHNVQTTSSPYELGADLFGQGGSGDPQASSHYKSRLKNKLNEKYSH